MSKTQENLTVEWKDLPWRKLEIRVWKLQKRIFRASQRGDLKAVRRLQKTLMRSWSAKCMAVRKVTQDNQGKKTAGVDGIKSLSPAARLNLISQLKLTGNSKPTRRVWIEKPGKTEKRPLGIPTMFDRALQALVKLVLEPEWEARFEPNSYGFRPGRSALDAIEAIFNNVCKKAKYVLDADIAKCFDRINHQSLLNKLNTFPTLRQQIKSWLKSGVMDEGIFSDTDEGTPQGGVISPLLANIALHGLEDFITGFKPKGYRYGAALVRYADDFVIIHESKDFVEQLQQQTESWLTGMGLELKPNKTHIRHTSEGFDFLGFNIRQYSVGAYRAATHTSGNKTKNLGFQTLITPSKEAIKRHLEKIGKLIDAHHNAPQEALINRLNPVILGWCNYYSTQVSKETFSKCIHLTFKKLLAWAKRRCSKSNAYDIVQKYWQTIGSSKWEFATKNGHRLIKHSETPIRRHVKVQKARSPFDGDTVYWGQRMRSHPEMPIRIKNLLEKQDGKCRLCELKFRDGDIMEVDHILPTILGGKDWYSNLQLLHRHCHHAKSAIDGSGTHNKSQDIEEPCDGKLSSTVLNERAGK
ncbi:MAG TPA: group II intron reverse transcriptase/maturase [Cyanobacteria bacterium UBA8553]|nr:group II intron reverse transcriptase/maturase [Cyanobacteria bacterium UBA8553]